MVPVIALSQQDNLSQLTQNIAHAQQELNQISNQKEHTEQALKKIQEQLNQNQQQLSKNIDTQKKSNEIIAALNQNELTERNHSNNQLALLSSLLNIDYNEPQHSHHLVISNIANQIHNELKIHQSNAKKSHQEKATTLAKRQKSMDDYFTLQQTQESLDKLKQKKISLQNNLDKHLKLKNDALLMMIKNKKKLESVIKSEKPKSTKLQGLTQRKYQAPVKGSIEHNYGETILFSDQKHEGITYALKPQPVHAIANGSVVYAHYLDGYGHLIIIDHGKGDLTLYGENKKLDVVKGDIVTAGQIIAESSDHTYFAIRKNNKPISPNGLIRS